MLVASVESSGPASQAGVREGDVIISFDGNPVRGIDDLHKLLTEEKVGEKSRLEVVRAAEKKVLTVIPSEFNRWGP